MRRSLLLVLVLLTAVLVPAPARAVDDVFTVWVSASGSDANDGTQAAPVASLMRAQEVLRAAQPTTDVEIRIDQGTYVTGPTVWTFYIPGRSISFMPDDYEVGDTMADIAGRPVFESNGQPGYWFAAKIPNGYTDAVLVARLRFYYLQVQHYGKGGLILYGPSSIINGYKVPGPTLTANTVYGMWFRQIGSKWADETAYAGLALVNSSFNNVRNNTFCQLEDVGSDAGAIHGIYAEDGASNNVIRGNTFCTISGHPMRTRNRSSNNDIFDNTFTDTGGAAYGEWFCDEACVAANPGSALECASSGNVFHDNTVVSRYGGGPLVDWWLSPAGLTNPGPSNCPALAGPRLTTYGNT